MRQTQVVAGSASKAAPARAKGTQHPNKEATTKGGAEAGAPVEVGSKGNQHRGEGTGKGTKRPAEAETDGQAHAASALRLAPHAKRQKTDAEWGMVISDTSVWFAYSVTCIIAVYVLFHVCVGSTCTGTQCKRQTCCKGYGPTRY